MIMTMMIGIGIGIGVGKLVSCRYHAACDRFGIHIVIYGKLFFFTKTMTS
jgi:hypothetical protein